MLLYCDQCDQKGGEVEGYIGGKADRPKADTENLGHFLVDFDRFLMISKVFFDSQGR